MRSERKTYKDPSSGVSVTQLTDYRGHSHHFYFTNSGWYENGRKLLFGSDRNNRTNLFGMDLESGEIEQLTDLDPVPLPRELEFLCASKNPVRDEVYFWHDLKLMGIDLRTRIIRTLFELDDGWCGSMTSCSADGRSVLFSVWEDMSDTIRTDMLRGYIGLEETWKARPRSQLISVAVDTGESNVLFKENYWIGHVNASPTQANILTFCHEGPWDKVDNRIWGLNTATGDVWKIRPTSEGKSVFHEYWFEDGVHIGYHGRASRNRHMLGHIRFDNSGQREYEFPGFTGHIFSRDADIVVGDGGGVIRIWKQENEDYAVPRLLCRHDSGMHIQQTHPHPRISPDGKYVVFTSDRTGYGNVYLVPLVKLDLLPAAESENS